MLIRRSRPRPPKPQSIAAAPASVASPRPHQGRASSQPTSTAGSTEGRNDGTISPAQPTGAGSPLGTTAHSPNPCSSQCSTSRVSSSCEPLAIARRAAPDVPHHHGVGPDRRERVAGRPSSAAAAAAAPSPPWSREQLPQGGGGPGAVGDRILLVRRTSPPPCATRPRARTPGRSRTRRCRAARPPACRGARRGRHARRRRARSPPARRRTRRGGRPVPASESSSFCRFCSSVASSPANRAERTPGAPPSAVGGDAGVVRQHPLGAAQLAATRAAP